MAGVTPVPREQAHRKCPYCGAESNTNSHPTKTATLKRPAGRPLEEGPEGAEVCHPHTQNPT